MATHRPTPSTPPDLPEGSGIDLPLDHALSLLLADETENALRWGAAVLENGPWTPSALVVTARLLDQMGRRRAATEGLKLAIQQAISVGNLPLAMAAIGDLRGLGVEVEDLLSTTAAAFCKGSDRLRETQAVPLLPQLGEFQPLSPFLTGPALASKAAQILESVRETKTGQPEPAPARIAPLPLFSALAEEPLRDLLAAFETVTVPAGHVVIREGGEEAAAYIVARGELEVSRRSADDEGKPLVLARLGSGAFFGEMAILSELPGAASVIATRPTILLVAKREALEAVVEKHPEVANELAAHCRRQAVANLGWASPVVVAIPPAERSSLVERFETRMFEAGDKLVETGEEAGGLHLVVSGEVAVVAYEGGERVVLATLTPGETVGEVELVLCRSSAADAIAVRPTATLFLPRQQFFTLVQDHPAILNGLYAMAVRRHAETKLALETGASTMADEALLDDVPRNVAALVEDVPGQVADGVDPNQQRITPLARGTMSLPRVTTPPRGTPLPAPTAGTQPARRSLPPPPLPPAPIAPAAAPVTAATGRVTAPPPLPRTTLPMGAPPVSPSVAPTSQAVMQRVQQSREDQSPKYGLVAAIAVAAAVIGFLVLRSGNQAEPAGSAATLAPPAAAAAPRADLADPQQNLMPEPLALAKSAAAATPATPAPPAAVPAAAPKPQAAAPAAPKPQAAEPAAPKPRAAAPAPKPVVVVEPNPSPAPPRAAEASAAPARAAEAPAARPVALGPSSTAGGPAKPAAELSAGEFGGRE